MTKKCIKCGIEKKLEEFNTGRNVCVICRKEYNKEYNESHKEQNKEQRKEYCKNHKEQIKEQNKEYRESHKKQRKEQKKEYDRNHKKQIKEQNKEYYENHKEQGKEQKKEYHKNHKEQIKEQNKEYYENHKEQRKEYKKEYREGHKEQANEQQKNRCAVDIQYKLACLLRGRLRGALKNNYKCGSAVRDLGCSILELKIKLEQMFYPNPKTGEMMSWENQGSGWHIDHIIPLSSFDLTDRDQLLKACHYTNLQPLWAEENLSKGAKLI